MKKLLIISIFSSLFLIACDNEPSVSLDEFRNDESLRLEYIKKCQKLREEPTGTMAQNCINAREIGTERVKNLKW